MRAPAAVMMIAAVVISGCGRLEFAEQPLDGDSGPLGPFGAPVGIVELNTASNQSDPALTGDMLEMYFDDDSGAGSDLYVTTRATTADAWGAPMLVAELNTASFDGAPGITPDGLTIYITTNRAGGAAGFDIWRATRPSRTSLWSAPVFVPELSSVDDDSNPQPSTDDLDMWLSSKRGGVAARQLYHATRTSTAMPWSTPVAVAEINFAPATSTEAPWASTDGLELFFASNRRGTLGANDLWHATRATTSDPFGAPEQLVELNSTLGDQDPWLSPDLHTIVFMSKRSGTGNDLFVATR